MKVYIRNFLAAALLLTLLLAVSAAPAGTSGRNLPDILGFRLGMTVPEVLAQAASINLLEKPAYQARQSIPGLHDSEFRPELRFSGPQGTFTFAFSPPPMESRLVAVERQVRYEQQAPKEAPTAAALKEALLEKFGPPTAKLQTTNISERLTWLWGLDGRLQTKGLGSACHLFTGRFWRHPAVITPPNPVEEKLLNDGCAQSAEVEILTAPSGVVKTLKQTVVDMAGGRRARAATYIAVQDARKKQNEQDLKDAKQGKPAL